MSKLGYTKGPWYIGRDFSDQGRHIYAKQKVRNGEGEEWHPLIATTDDDERLVDWQSNARLIVCAPELLETLEQVLFECRSQGLDWECLKTAQRISNKARGLTWS